MMKNIIVGIIILILIYIALGSYGKKKAKENPLQKYTEGLKTCVDKTKEVAYKANRMKIKRAISFYQVSKGRYPESLDVLVREKFLDSIPSNPSGEWIYSPTTGEIR